MSTRLRMLQENIHLRKIKHIEEDSEQFHCENRQFAKRQENILLNALQFISDMVEMNAEDEIPEELKGIDQGFECRLDQEQRDRPEF